MPVRISNSIEVCGIRVDTLDDARKAIIDSCEQMVGTSLKSLPPEDYNDLILQLDKLGFFSLRGAATYLAKRMGLSRVTIYNALKRNMAK